jgi:hypothetical protein
MGKPMGDDFSGRLGVFSAIPRSGFFNSGLANRLKTGEDPFF